jgi:hypothetical protein
MVRFSSLNWLRTSSILQPWGIHGLQIKSECIVWVKGTIWNLTSPYQHLSLRYKKRIIIVCVLYRNLNSGLQNQIGRTFLISY